MQTTSATYKSLLLAQAPKEVQAIIAGVTYGQDKIVSASVSAAVEEESATIGNCVAKQLHLVLKNPGTIPRMAQIQMRYRLNNGTQQSEWIPKGTFYIDTRQEDTFGVLTIDAYDAMLMTEQDFMQSGNQGQWPRSDITIVNQIASRIGVTVDPRTTEIIRNSYMIPYPGYGEGAFTMREMLGYIGALYAGNFIITDEDKLRLLGLGEIPPETNYLVTEDGGAILFGNGTVKLLV